MDVEIGSDYRQGRIDQTQWMVEQLTQYVKANPEIIAFVPHGFREFLSRLLTESVQEAAHGTRSVIDIEIRA